ncbi:alpha/beta fold hydrolase [Microbispora sp. CA-135349]|uniref:alpha/beta fold hydrolase n=1 Tax=Microbispora sp. CA-135349 TaxID=3239953 RepID=UPI003D936E0F
MRSGLQPRRALSRTTCRRGSVPRHRGVKEEEKRMATFVLVPGGWHGSWSFEAVVPLLERAGHAVHALTLTGLRPDDDNATVATANLGTDADDVLRLLDRARITSATLVGHSYGGRRRRSRRRPGLTAGASRRLRTARWRVVLVVDDRALPGGVRRRRRDHRLRRPAAGRRRSPPPSSSPRLVPANDPAHGHARPGPPPGVRLLLGMGRPDAVRRAPHPASRRSRVAGPRPPDRPRRDARGPGGGRHTTARSVRSSG